MKRPEDFAADAAKASENGEHREAERLYLLAAARASAYTNQPTMHRNATRWDRCAVRERRLAELTKKSRTTCENCTRPLDSEGECRAGCSQNTGKA